MSPPTSSFSKLAICQMPPTSSSTSRHSRTRDDPVSSTEDSSGSEEESGDDSDTSTSGILTSTNTNLQYDTSRLTPTTSSRARDGLRNSFTIIDSSSPSSSPPKEYFAFQIGETSNFAVRVGPPGTQYATLTCHCDNEDGPNTKPCRHVFFLLDQIADHTLNEDQKDELLPLTKDGVARETLDAFKSMKNAEAAGLGLLEKLQGGSITNLSHNQESKRYRDVSVGAKRINDVRDILASFSGSNGRDEYRPDIFNHTLRQTISENEHFPKDLEKTLAVSMLTNDNLFNHMDTIVPPSYRASDYFDKKYQQVMKAFAAMDTYTRTRPAKPVLPLPHVSWCANIIERAVTNIVARLIEAPLPQDARKSAAQALSQILRDLSDRNIDVYNHTKWGQSKEQVLDIRERNIFVRFFGYRPEDGKKFILDDLSGLTDVLKEFQPLIEHAAEAFRDKKVSKTYADKYQRLLRDFEGTGRSVRSKSGSKRPGDESGGDNKRMK